MQQHELKAAIRKQPFQPFRVHLSNGSSYDVRHPEMAALSRRTLYVLMYGETEDAPDRMIECDVLHVVALETIDGVSAR